MPIICSRYGIGTLQPGKEKFEGRRSGSLCHENKPKRHKVRKIRRRYRYKRQWCVILRPLLPNGHRNHVEYSVSTDEAMMTESQRGNCSIRNRVNAVPKHAFPEAKGSKPTTGLTLLWVRNPFRGKSNYWQGSQEVVTRSLKLLLSNYWKYPKNLEEMLWVSIPLCTVLIIK
jgi:hypothetical protein